MQRDFLNNCRAPRVNSGASDTFSPAWANEIYGRSLFVAKAAAATCGSQMYSDFIFCLAYLCAPFGTPDKPEKEHVRNYDGALLDYIREQV
jgi:hypothetical protein